MQVCGPVLWSLFALFGAYGAGLLAVIGRAYGAKDTTRVQSALGSGFLIALAAGTTIGIVGYLTRDTITAVIATGDAATLSVRGLASTYMGIVLLASPLQMLGSAATVSLQGLGDTRTPMLVSIFSGAANLGISLVLVFGYWGLPAMGIKGAAIGTVASFAINAIALYAVLFRQRDGYEIGHPSLRTMKRIFRVAGPAFGEKAVFHGAYLVFAIFIGHLGTDAMTAHQALMAIESLGFIGASAFGVAAGALVAQKLGADHPEQAVQAGHISARLGIICLSGVAVILFIGARPLVGLFTDNPDIIDLGATCLRIAAIAQPLMAITDVYAGALRGAGDTKTPMIAALGGPVLVRLSACYLLAYTCGLGLIGIWIGSTLDWLVRAIYLFLVFRRGKWKRILV